MLQSVVHVAHHESEARCDPRRAPEEIQHGIVECITKKGPKTMFACGEKGPKIIFSAFGEKDPHILFCLRPKMVRGSKLDVRQAAHVLVFVVRCAELSGKWCNCATFNHLIITLVLCFFAVCERVAGLVIAICFWRRSSGRHTAFVEQ